MPKTLVSLKSPRSAIAAEPVGRGYQRKIENGLGA